MTSAKAANGGPKQHSCSRNSPICFAKAMLKSFGRVRWFENQQESAESVKQRLLSAGKEKLWTDRRRQRYHDTGQNASEMLNKSKRTPPCEHGRDRFKERMKVATSLIHCSMLQKPHRKNESWKEWISQLSLYDASLSGPPAFHRQFKLCWVWRAAFVESCTQRLVSTGLVCAEL